MFITIKNNGKTRTWTCFGEISPNNMLLCCLCNRISALFTRMSEKEVLHVGRRPRGLVIDLDIFTSKKRQLAWWLLLHPCKCQIVDYAMPNSTIPISDQSCNWEIIILLLLDLKAYCFFKLKEYVDVDSLSLNLFFISLHSSCLLLAGGWGQNRCFCQGPISREPSVVMAQWKLKGQSQADSTEADIWGLKEATLYRVWWIFCSCCHLLRNPVYKWILTGLFFRKGQLGIPIKFDDLLWPDVI